MSDSPTLDDLLNHYQPDDGETFSSDPVELTQRLSRKLAASPPPEQIDFTPKTKKPEAQKAPDLSSFGEPVPEPSNDDLSSFGEEVKPPAPKPGVLATVGQEAKSFGKGLLRGAPEAIGSMSQGAAALAGPVKPISPEGTALVDELGNSGSMTAGERAKLMGRALRTIGDRGAQMDFNSALQRIAQGSDATSEAQALREKFNIQNTDETKPVEQQIRYQAGKKLKDWIDKTVPMTDEEKSSVGGQVGTGISSMAPYLAAGIIAGPEAGVILGAAGMGAQTAGDTFEAAKAKGATDQVAAKAAGWSGAIGAALGTLPLGAVFRPVSAASDTWKSWFAAKLVQAGQSGVTFASVGEAQHFLLQEVAKEQYDPQAGYSPDAKRVISSLLTGGVLGTMHPLTPKPSDLSSPEVISDFLRRASGTGRTPEEEANHQRGAQTRSEIDDFLRERDAREATTAPRLPKPEDGEAEPPEGGSTGPQEPNPSPSGGEAVPHTEQTEIEGLKRYGWTDDEIASMTPAQRRREFQDAMETGQSEPAKPATKSDVGPTIIDRDSLMAAHADKDGRVDAGKVASDVTTQVQTALDAGHSVMLHVDGKAVPITSVVNGMMADAKGQRWGTMPLLAPSPGKRDRVEITPAEIPVNATPGTRDEPIKATTAEHVINAQPAEPKSQEQAEAENYKHAHLDIDHLGLTGRNNISIETGVGQTRKGVDANGKPWEVTMPVAYGRIKGTKGADDQPLDIFIGPVPTSPHVFIVDQHRNEGGFDEHKIMAGFPGPDAALRAYGDSYEDKGGNRIGHVTAMTPDQFKDWIKGDTTQPLKRSLSEQELGNLFDEMVGTAGSGSDHQSGEKGGEPEVLSESEGSPQLPHESSDGGRSPSHAGADRGKIAPQEGEIVSPGKVYAEPTEEHHAQIEAVLGADYHHVLPVDASRAAEILAENPDISPSVAFQYAVIENAAAQKFLTQQQLEQAYGPEVKTVLESGGQRASGSGEHAEQIVTKSDQKSASGGEEIGIVSSGGETGPRGPAEHEPATENKNGEQHDTGGEKPNSRRKARGGTNEESADDTEGPDDAEWWSGLETTDRMLLQSTAGIPGKFKIDSPWAKIPRPARMKLLGAREPLDQQKAERAASRAMEDALDRIEEAVEADDRKAVTQAASGARKLLADMPQRIKDADTDYWSQFGDVISKMEKPGYVTGKQEAEKYYNSPMQPERSFEDASQATIENYAKGLDINIKGKSRQELIDAMIAKGARGYQSGGIIAVPRSAKSAAEIVSNRGLTAPVPASLFDKFKAALKTHADKIESRADIFETEPSGDTWSWRVKAGGGSMNLTAYGDQVYITGGTTKKDPSRHYGSEWPLGMVQSFMRDFISENPPPAENKPERKPRRPDSSITNPTDKNGGQLKVGDRVKAMSVGGHPYEATIKSFHVSPGDIDAAEIESDEKFKSRPPLSELEKVEVTGEKIGGADSLVDAFTERLKGEGFKNILDARRVARDYGINVQSKENGWQPDSKGVEEAIEFAVVKVAREIIETSKSPYPELVNLYGKQPKLGTRTSTSVRDQAYSTPVPLGYLAQKLAGVTNETTVYEPTAGNGALLTTADPRKVYANEINPIRRSNLDQQGFTKVTSFDASDADKGKRLEDKKVDRVIANPPFGPVRQENGESKVFDMSGIQPGYKTSEIDHAIALRSLDAMKDDGRGVLILAGLNKQLTTTEGRSNGYNGKAKREFYLTLYGNYNVTDHFTVNGDLYERQGAGWPVDVIVVNGRGKSARALPAVDIPRIYDTWEALGGLLDGRQDEENAGAVERPDGVSSGSRSGLEGSGQPDRASARRRGSPSGDDKNGTDGVRNEPVRGQSETERAGGNGDQEQGGPVSDRPADGSGEPSPAERSPSRLSADKIGDLFDDLVGGKPDTRTAPEVAKSAVKNAASAADEALSGLTKLFGGGKTVGMGINFDEDTYKQARPMFEAAAEKFADYKYDIRELMRRMLDHLRDAHKWTTEMLKAVRPYVIRFMQDVQEGVVSLHKPAEETKSALQPKVTTKAAETAGQATYEPQSKAPGLDTLVPVNMKKSISDALADLEKKVGPIDDFVAKELQWSKDDLESYLGAEQVDAVALAIDNLKKGKGFIIGDQTGIGKGRVNAAIIRWAILNGRVPVFTTEKPGLYADMFRDLTDIGMDPSKLRILATNAGLSMPLDDAGKHWIKTADSKKHNALMLGLTDPEKFRERYDMVFTNYSQMQTLKGESTDRRRFMSMIIPQSTIIFDESHNAGGQVKERKQKGVAADRSEFARDLVKKANGVFYSSATYAKRPDVMDLYAATDMVMAVAEPHDLGEAISRGGIPMQQVVAAMLAKSGQYIRRERSFAGINYNTPSVDVNHETYDQISHALASIQEFSGHVKDATAEIISRDLKAAGKAVGHDNAVSDPGASSTNFTSVMHNIINQMLLAMKAPEAAKMAVQHIKNGEKPVLTVANTMESFLKDYADTLDIKPGDEIDADFADVLMKYLDRSRRITIRKPFGKESEHHVLTDAELGPLGVNAYNNTKATIAQMDLAHLPISPIDYLKGELQKAGYDVGEITGRGLTIDYTGEKPVLRVRPGSEITTKGRNETRRRFNLRPAKNGLHAIIINQAGSTGISMHAGEKFDDQSKRRMIVVQPEGNIDTHMQLLGRVNRTGQVVLPEYDQLVANIPAEKRPAAVLAKKMASLNANTTASRSSAVTAKDVPDFMNQYGDMVAANYLSDNFEVNERLAWPVKPGEGKLKFEDAMRKLTGRIPLLPLTEQETLYQTLEEEYAALIKQVEASGASPLEAKTMDLKARTLETTEVQGPKNGSGSPFAAPVNVEKVSVLRQGKPFKPHELMNMLGQRVGGTSDHGEKADQGMLADMLRHFDQNYQLWGKTASNIEQKERTAKVDEFNAYTRPLIEKIEDVPAQTKERDKYNAIKDRWTAMHTMLPIGKRVRLNMFDANPVAVVLDVKQDGNPKNPLALGSWKVHFAVADASRQMVLPFSRLYEQGKADTESVLDVEVVSTNETAKDTLARFEMMQSGAREERFIATGNLLAAYDWLNMKGSIINYTDAQSAVRQGIMTPKDFDLGKHAIAKGKVVADPVELKRLLDENQTVWSKDRQANLSRADRWSDNYQIQAEKKKATGGRYYLDPALTKLTGDFSSRGGMMTATVPGRDLGAAIARMQEIGAQFTVAAAAPQATKVDSPEPPPDDEPPGGGGATLGSRMAASPLTTEAERLYGQIEQHLRNVVARVAGPDVRVDFNRGLMQLGGGSPGYTADTGQMAAGTYTLGSDLIRLALLPGRGDLMATAAYHESYHHIEARLQTEQERKLMEQETPRLREWIKGKTGLKDAQVDGLAGYEVRAIAFQTYASERETGKTQAGAGIHIMVRRWFDRLMEGLRALGNALRGLGFKTHNDIFNEAYTGEFARREPNEKVGLDPNSLAARWDIFRRDQNTAVTGRLRDVMNSATAADRIKEKVQNLNEGVRRLEDAVEARMEGELPDSKAFYQKKRLFPGKVATEVQDFNKQHLDPLIDTLKERGLTLDQVGDILYAQHAAERNAHIDTINPDADGMGSGMSNDEAQAVLDRYNARDLAEVANRIDGIRDFILDTMVRSGLESQATTNAWRAQYEHYVPLGGFSEPNEDVETFRESGKFNVRGREVKRAFGRRSKADNPLLNVLDQAYRTIERAKKNEYLRSLKLALSSLETEDLKGFVQFDQGKPRREIDPRTGLVRWVDDSSYRFSPSAVAFKVGGNTRYMVFDKRDIADVLRRMHPDALNGVGQALLTIQNKLKAMWTHYSPEFLIRHFLFRYPIEGTLNSFEQGPSNVPRYMADSIPFLGRASKAIFATNKGIVHPDAETAQYQRYWTEMREAGGAMAFRQARDVDLLREHLQKKLSAISGKPLATIRDKHRAAVEAMDTVTNALDNSLRLAAYATARGQGKTPEQAAIVARDATVDFQQAGAWKNAIGLWFPFGNVAIQTGARMGSAVLRSKTMRRVFAGTIMAGFLSGMFNYLVGGDDKDGIPFIDKMPEWEKHLNFTVMNPFHHDDKGRPVPIHIPLPYNWAFPFALGQAMATMAFSKTRGAKRKMMGMAIKAGVEAFSPFAEEGNLAAELAPEITRPVVHAYTNQNWTGNPQHLEAAFQKGPRSESGFKSTGEGWKYSARMLNSVSGGDNRHSGYVDMFPEDLRELFDYYSGTGTQRKFISNVATTAQNTASGKPTDYSKMPLARVVMGTDYDASDRFRRQEQRREDKRPWER